jgi:hypothetical protein
MRITIIGLVRRRGGGEVRIFREKYSMGRVEFEFTVLERNNV